MTTSTGFSPLAWRLSVARWLGFALALIVASAPLRATSVIPPTFNQLVNESDCIVRAVVKSVTAEWREANGRRHIYTFVALDVKEVIAGTPAQPLVLQLLGGRIGDEEMVLGGAPRFKVGDEDILFIRGNGESVFPLVAIMHGRFPVLKDPGTGREYVARNNRQPLEDIAETSLPMTDVPVAKGKAAKAMSPAAFVQRARAERDPSYRRQKLN